MYRFAGGHDSWHQKVMAATLSLPGAMASHKTAAFLWRIQGLGGAPAMLEVSVAHGTRRTLRLAKVHHTRRLPTEPERREQIPVTPLARTVLDLSDILGDEKLFLAFDSALKQQRTLIPALEKELKDNGAGRRNADLLSDMVRRWKGDGPTDSSLEGRTAFAMEAHGTLRPKRQLVVRDPQGHYIAKVDFAWIEHRVILQCDSHDFHLKPHEFEKDLLQRRKLESHGWRVVHVTWRMLADKDWLVDLDRLLAAQTPRQPSAPA